MTKKDMIKYILKNAKKNNMIIVYNPNNLKAWLEKQTDDYIQELYEMI